MVFATVLLHRGPSWGREDEPGTLYDEISKLFDQFVDKGPGKSRFVRVRFHSMLSCSEQHEQMTEEYFSYGPLVKAERIDRGEASPGARLLDAAYRLERTSPRLQPEEPFIGPI